MRIIAFAASSSKKSINKQLVEHTLTHFPEAECTLLDLNDFEMPLFSVDREAESGHPKQAYDFLGHMASADLLIVSMAEHNGNFTTAWKNLLDWCSRVEEKQLFFSKPMFLMSTSPGGYGGRNSLEAAEKRFPKHAADIVTTFSLPRFHQNFHPERGVFDETLKAEYLGKIALVRRRMKLDEPK